MFDGFKAKCSVSPETWTACDVLPFVGKYNVSTGEALRVPLVAEYNALKFELVPSTVSETTHAILRGSLHRFFNSGGTNSNRFTLSDVCETIEQLHKKFGIVPHETTIQNLEFGVNIETPLPAQWYVKNLIAYSANRFVELVLERVKVGKQCIKKRYTIKVYDKGKQANNPRKNILRIEVRVNEMSVLKPYGIATLADLKDRIKVEPLGVWLSDIVNSLVMFDKHEPQREMSDRDRIKFLRYQTHDFWENVGYSKRSDHLKAYKELCSRNGIEQPTSELSKAVKMEWETLLNNGAIFSNDSTKTGVCLGQLKHRKIDTLSGVFGELEYTTQTHLFMIDIFSIMKRDKKVISHSIFCPKPPKIFKPKFCVSCGKQIYYQRKQSRFCSAKYVGEKQAKRCRNIASGKARTIKARLNRAIERNQFVAIVYNNETIILHSSEIKINPIQLKFITALKGLYIQNTGVDSEQTKPPTEKKEPLSNKPKHDKGLRVRAKPP